MSYDLATNQAYPPTLPTLSPQQESLRQRITRQKAELEERLANINAALELLDKNPQLEEFHNAIQKTGW